MTFNFFKQIVTATSIIILTACGGGGGGNGTAEMVDQEGSDYIAMTEVEAGAYFAGKVYQPTFQTVHTDGFGNSDKGIIDLNVVMMDRAENGDLYIAYDGVIHSYDNSLNDPSSWSGSTIFSVYVDIDNNPQTGEVIGDIGADIRLDGSVQYIWSASTSSWESTWFELAPPPLDIHVYKRMRYLDALVFNSDAKAIIQVKYDIYDQDLLTDTRVPLDTSDSFSVPSF